MNFESSPECAAEEAAKEAVTCSSSDSTSVLHFPVFYLPYEQYHHCFQCLACAELVAMSRKRLKLDPVTT